MKDLAEVIAFQTETRTIVRAYMTAGEFLFAYMIFGLGGHIICTWSVKK